MDRRRIDAYFNKFLDGKPFEQCYTVDAALDRRCREVKEQTCSGGWTFESEYFESRFYKKGTVHLKWKREDLWEAFNKTAAAGKKWLGEDTQQYRPKQLSKNPDWYCEEHGHKFVDGVCSRCGDPEMDEVAVVECELCRAIFEHTGERHCPIHELPGLTIIATTEYKALPETASEESFADISDAVEEALCAIPVRWDIRFCLQSS